VSGTNLPSTCRTHCYGNAVHQSIMHTFDGSQRGECACTKRCHVVCAHTSSTCAIACNTGKRTLYRSARPHQLGRASVHCRHDAYTTSADRQTRTHTLNTYSRKLTSCQGLRARCLQRRAWHSTFRPRRQSKSCQHRHVTMAVATTTTTTTTTTSDDDAQRNTRQ
jgi:hypothetical protein